MKIIIHFISLLPQKYGEKKLSWLNLTLASNKEKIQLEMLLDLGFQISLLKKNTPSIGSNWAALVEHLKVIKRSRNSNSFKAIFLIFESSKLFKTFQNKFFCFLAFIDIFLTVCWLGQLKNVLENKFTIYCCSKNH